ncbi:MAG: energy transducer TonB [Pyrinomonadaceae bacterium]|nr:energy transducer TonB [Pyrinomonadaceae bacterium]
MPFKNTQFKNQFTMEKISLIFSFILFVFVFNGVAQEKYDWTRIESENKEISVSLPSNFLVDAVKKDYDNQRLRIIGFQNGVQMELLIYDMENPKKYLQQLKVDGESKKIGSGDDGFTLKRTSSKDDGKYFADTILLASKNNFYCFIVTAETADKSEISQFLYSIKARGKSIFVDKNRANTVTEKFVSTGELKTSPEVSAALNQTADDSSRKVNYEFKKVAPDKDADDFSIRAPIILVEPHISGKSSAVRPGFNASWLGQNSGAATFKVKLLSNGQIGDITVFSISDRRILYELVEAVKRVKFLPAVKNGKTVDSEWTVNLKGENY